MKADQISQHEVVSPIFFSLSKAIGVEEQMHFYPVVLVHTCCSGSRWVKNPKKTGIEGNNHW